MPADTADRYSALIRSPYGMVICAGPTGSGKTTTLYASLGELNSPDRNIMTIEDPVEYTFPSINQIQINEQAGITFASGLKSILRQDPDVILVGEIRDVETARIAVQSALTGHFVLSSLHATDVGRGAVPPARHGHRVLPDRLVGHRRRRPAAGPAHLHQLPGALPAGGRGAGLPPQRQRRASRRERLRARRRLQLLRAHRLPGADRRLRAAAGHRRGARARSSSARRTTRCASSRCAQGMRTLQEEAVRLVCDGTTTAAEVMRSIYVAGV